MNAFWRKILIGNRRSIVAQIVTMLISAGISISAAYVYMKLIDYVTVGNMRMVFLLCAIYVLALAMGFLLNVLIAYGNKKISNRIDIELKGRVFEKLVAKTGEELSQTDSSEYTSLLLADTGKVGEVITSLALPALLSFFRVIGMTLFLAYVNWKLLIVVFVVQPVMWFVQGKLKKEMKELAEDNRSKTIGFLEAIKEYTSNLFEIILLGNDRYFKRKLIEHAKIHKKSEVKLMLAENKNEGILGMLTILPTVILLAMGSYEVTKGSMTVGALLIYVQYYSSIFSPLGEIFGSIFSFESFKPSIARVAELVMDTKEEEGSTIRGDVLFSNVSFSYDGENKVLQQVNVGFRSGNVYGLYGESGCGKSTLCKLLLGFWSPTEGKITIGKDDIQTIPKTNLRKHICYVSQNNYMFNDTIYNNIVLGKECTKERFESILEVVNLKSFVDGLLEKEQTRIGDNGAMISGGQKKRIALARTLIDPAPIVILDEPTNGLDQENAMDVMLKCLKEYEKSIVIVISHQTDVISLCDKRYCLENGEIRNA